MLQQNNNTGHKLTGPPCSMGRPTRPPVGVSTVYVPERRQRSPRRFPMCPPAGSVTDDDRRQSAASKRIPEVVTCFECRCNSVTKG